MRRLWARNPRTGTLDEAFEALSAGAVRRRAEALRAAQPAWEKLGVEGRARLLVGLADRLEGEGERLAAALEADTGRRRISRIEVQSVVGSLRGWAALAPGLLKEGWTAGRSRPEIRHAPQYVPYPLVGVISPWNFPLLLGMIDAAPALLAGSAVLLKPSEIAPRFAAPLEDLLEASGLAHVFGIARGDGLTGRAVVAQADCICFTGSVAVGRKVAAAAGRRLIPAFLELGGKDPMVILEGSDLEAATVAALRGAVLSSGQACQSIERIYVARADYAPFLGRLVAAASAVRLNTPDIAVGELGPLISEAQAGVLRGQIEDARAKGGKVLTGGVIETHGGGLWLAPTVIADLRPDMRLFSEETFGPLLPVQAFDTEEEAVALANSGAFGLSAAVFGPTLADAERIGRRIEAGAISLNDAALTALFHEAPKQSFKASGLGPSRMGAEGFLRFYRRKALIANEGAPAPLAAFREDV
jgi:acyl-CoA reductase-like NAD-dependent aldehyde dehydrogenase